MKLSIKSLFNRSLQPLVAATALLIASGSAQAAAFIKFDGVDGESADEGHKEWINLGSFSAGMSAEPAADPASGTPIVTAKDFRVESPSGKSSPKLLEAVCLGKVFPKVVIELTETAADGSQQTYYRYELTNVLVTSYDVGGSADSRPMESFSLNFEEIKVVSVDADGSRGGNVEFGWKVEKGER